MEPLNASSGRNSLFYLLHFISLPTVFCLHPGSSPFVYIFYRFGHTMCPVCMGDPHDPLCLPCKHIYCVACIKKWLCPGQMYCPLCMQPVTDDFPLVPSEATRLVTACGLELQELILFVLFLMKGAGMLWFFQKHPKSFDVLSAAICSFIRSR